MKPIVSILSLARLWGHCDIMVIAKTKTLCFVNSTRFVYVTVLICFAPYLLVVFILYIVRAILRLGTQVTKEVMN